MVRLSPPRGRPTHVCTSTRWRGDVLGLRRVRPTRHGDCGVLSSKPRARGGARAIECARCRRRAHVCANGGRTIRLLGLQRDRTARRRNVRAVARDSRVRSGLAVTRRRTALSWSPRCGARRARRRCLPSRSSPESATMPFMSLLRRPVSRLLATLALASAALRPASASAQAWQTVPNAPRFARSGAPTVTLELRQHGGGGCGGGGCNTGVMLRNVRGQLPARSASYYYSDRPGANPGCLQPNHASLFASWTEAVIAPAAGTEADRPSCGIGMMVGSVMQYWVILRVRTLGPPAAAQPARP